MFELKYKSQKNLDLALSTLRDLEGNIETLRMLRLGWISTNQSVHMDIVLTTHFEDKEGLAEYVLHPKHLPVIVTMRALCKNSIVVLIISRVSPRKG